MNSSLERWLRGNIGLREISLNRILADEARVEVYVDNCRRDGKDCYVSVFTDYQIWMGIYDTVLLDIDGDVEDPYSDMRTVYSILKNNLLDGRVYYTGRGYHIYIDFMPIRIDRYSDRVRRWAEELGILKYVDRKVLGDIRRMARVPLTKNTKTGRWMVEIDPEMDEKEIIENSEAGVEVVRRELKPTDLGERLLLVDVNGGRRITPRALMKVKDGKYPPCIEQALMKLKVSGELDHAERLHLANYLLRVMSVDEVVDVFRYAKDFSERYTRYQLEWFLRNNYKPYSCARAIQMGICPCMCKYYPNVLNSLEERE